MLEQLCTTTLRAVETIVAAIQQLMEKREPPILVALDGGSGAGKSTVATLIAARLNAALVQSDDFFAAEIPAVGWDARSPAAKVRDVIDWQRLRAEVLEPLLAGKRARWHAFDFAAQRPDGSYPLRADFVEREPAAIIVLDGAYSTRPELTDLIDLSVLVEVPLAVRHARLRAREPQDFLDGWHARWDVAEDYYFTQVRPRSVFDLVVEFGASSV